MEDIKNNDAETIMDAAKQYVEWEPNEQFRSQVSEAIKKKDDNLLKKMFEKRIAFGTAGLRSKMYGGYAYMNDLVIIQTSQGLAEYCIENIKDAKSRGLIIGYDGRHNSKRFAEITASVFSSYGYKIYMFNRFAATPLIPYGLLQLKCAVGIVITASHNPKLDNGYKVYWENGAQIIPPHDDGIATSILNNLKPKKNYDYFVLEKIKDEKLKKQVDITDIVSNSYFEEIGKRYSYFKKDNEKIDWKVTYTPMHGVGGHWITKAFQVFNLPKFIPVKEQYEPDPEFSTVEFPNPEEGAGALKLAMQTANQNKSPLIIANDPDADRLAIAEVNKNGNDWKILNGNEIALLLSDWTLTNYLANNPNCDTSKLFMLASTVSSKFLASMAKHHGFIFRDTLTGFKWMGNTAVEMVSQGYTFLFAYEVEIGFLIGDSSYDKDGIRTGAAFYEMASQYYKQGKSCTDKINELRAKYGYFEMENAYRFIENDKLLKVFERLRTGFDNNSYPKSMGKYKITRIRDVTTGYDSGEKNLKSALPIQPNQQMITFWFENGATATLRNSGTEPKLKYYVETMDEKDPKKAKELLKEMTSALLKEFMQME